MFSLGRRLLVGEAPPLARGVARNLAASFGREQLSASRPALESAEPAEGRRVGVTRQWFRASSHHGDALGGRMTARAGAADRLCLCRLLAHLFFIAHEAPATNGQDGASHARVRTHISFSLPCAPRNAAVRLRLREHQ